MLDSYVGIPLFDINELNGRILRKNKRLNENKRLKQLYNQCKEDKDDNICYLMENKLPNTLQNWLKKLCC